MSKKEPPKKDPPVKAIKSIQYDLFSQFVTNDPDSVSNGSVAKNKITLAVSPGRDDSLQKAQGNLPIRSAR